MNAQDSLKINQSNELSH